MAHFKKHNITGMNVPRSQSYEGRFGRLFREMKWTPPGKDDDEIEKNISDFTNAHMFNPEGADTDSDNENLPAAYTYFGQFVDHDVTFDPMSSLMRANDPDSLTNFRSPRLDLDCVYGRGPSDQPYMYDHAKDKIGPDGGARYFLIGTGENPNEPDLPRNNQGRALIGDMRNDENGIVSQIQLAFLKLHNRVLAKITGNKGATGEQFEEAQRIVRWFYQYVVWNDYIKRLVADNIWDDALKRDGLVWKANKDCYNPKRNAFMPVEFSVAAYRFGHSLVRPTYKVNDFLEEGGNVGFRVDLPIFDPLNEGNPDLRGFRRLPKDRTIQWNWFLQMKGSSDPFPQPSQLIDRKLSRGVFHIDIGNNQTNPLADLNIKRGWRMELPSGPAVACAMGFEPITLEHEHEKSLWVYILREAEKLRGVHAGKQLGPVGGTIVAHVIAGMLKRDDKSFISMAPDWTPEVDKASLPFSEPLNDKDGWSMADIIMAAGMPVTAEDVKKTIDGTA